MLVPTNNFPTIYVPSTTTQFFFHDGPRAGDMRSCNFMQFHSTTCAQQCMLHDSLCLLACFLVMRRWIELEDIVQQWLAHFPGIGAPHTFPRFTILLPQVYRILSRCIYMKTIYVTEISYLILQSVGYI
jgi:hypothetical protein